MSTVGTAVTCRPSSRPSLGSDASSGVKRAGTSWGNANLPGVLRGDGGLRLADRARSRLNPLANAGELEACEKRHRDTCSAVTAPWATQTHNPASQVPPI